MPATRLDITIEQGADFDGLFAVDFDLTGYSAALQIKLAPGYPTALLTLTTANGGLAIEALAREVVAVIPAATASAIVAGRYVYDLVLTSPAGLTTRPFQGAACVSAGVTGVPVGSLPTTAATWDAGLSWDSGLTWPAAPEYDSGLIWDNTQGTWQ